MPLIALAYFKEIILSEIIVGDSFGADRIDYLLRDSYHAGVAYGRFDHFRLIDNEVLVALLDAERDITKPGHDAAGRIVNRKHYKLVYKKNPDDLKINPEAGSIIFKALEAKYGPENVRQDAYPSRNSTVEFPVLCNDGRITASFDQSQTLQRLPEASFDYIFIRPDLNDEARTWLGKNRIDLLQSKPGED